VPSTPDEPRSLAERFGIEMNADPGGGRAPKSTRRRRLERVLWVLLAALVLAVGGGALSLYLVVAHFSEGLPSVETLKSDYDPPQISRVVAADGTLLSSVFTERRTVIPFDTIPAHTKLAFLAAEDARFYEHEGLNYLGLLRALIVDLRTGRIAQGASTITQQVVKTILLNPSGAPERRGSAAHWRRKIQDMILAVRLEQNLTKDEIFSLYLNHIQFGHGRYGIEEAGRYYFGKRASELDLAESAMLAGIVQSPQRLSPRTHMDRALSRRRYVLEQMRAKGFVTPEYFEQLVKAPPPDLAPEVDKQSALCPEAVETAKKALNLARKEFGGQGGYTVTTTIRPELQLAARQAVRKAIDEYAERHRLHPPYESKSIKSWGKPFRGKPNPNRVYVGVVRATDDQTGRIDVQVGDVTGQVVLADEDRYNPKRLSPSQFASIGSVLRVRLVEPIDPEAERPPLLRLELAPQGALVAIDVQSRDIVALVGSYEAVPGNLDRARQARRQPGSSFKPIVYAYALRAREVTAASVLDLTKKGRGVSDQPPYKISVRHALAMSNNEAAVQLLQIDGPAQVVDFARELGIESKLGADLSLALGSYEVTPLEMANAFATFASGGTYMEPRLVASIQSPHVTEAVLQPREPARKVLEPDEAYLITSLLESVVTTGTGQKAREIGYPVAGKTGTTNDNKDAWFVGYSTDLAVAVWIGFDDALPLGDGSAESGTRTALPAFVDFMTKAHEGRPRTEFPKPSGIVVAHVDPETGLLPRPGQTNTLSEEFLDGTVPVQVAPEPMPGLQPCLEQACPVLPCPEQPCIPVPDNRADMLYKPDPGDLNELPP
jgi:penicillin-binding protein 1A